MNFIVAADERGLWLIQIIHPHDLSLLVISLKTSLPQSLGIILQLHVGHFLQQLPLPLQQLYCISKLLLTLLPLLSQLLHIHKFHVTPIYEFLSEKSFLQHWCVCKDVIFIEPTWMFLIRVWRLASFRWGHRRIPNSLHLFFKRVKPTLSSLAAWVIGM